MDNNFHSDKEFAKRRKEIQKKRAQKKQTQRKKAFKNFLIFMSVVLVLVFIVVSLIVFFPVKKITINGEKTIYSTDEIIKTSGIKKGDNLFVSGTNSEEKIITNFPYISSAKITRKISGEIVITLKNSTVCYCYAFEKNYYLCDSNNKLLEVSKKAPKNAMLVVGLLPKETELGQQVEFENLENLEILLNIKKTTDDLKINMTYINISDSLDIKLKVDNNFTVLLGAYANYDKKLLHLSEMLKNSEKGQKGTFDVSVWTEENPVGIYKKG